MFVRSFVMPASLVLALGVATAPRADSGRVPAGERVAQGPAADPSRNDPRAPNPAASPGRAATGVPGRAHDPHAGERDAAAESDDRRAPHRPGQAAESGPGSGAGL
jgi:hypothetical protein